MVEFLPYMQVVVGSNPTGTTLIKLVYEQPLRWDALVRMEVRSVKRHGVESIR